MPKEHVIYLKVLYSPFFRGPAAEWYADTTGDAATSDRNRTAFIDNFSEDVELIILFNMIS